MDSGGITQPSLLCCSKLSMGSSVCVAACIPAQLWHQQAFGERQARGHRH